MSLGLFNCRLIQPAGDQLFFFVGCLAAPLPVRASSVQSPCDPSCSAPTNGRAQNASCLSFSESSCFGFRRGRSPVGCRRVHSHRFTREFPRRSPILRTASPIEPQIPAQSRKWLGEGCRRTEQFRSRQHRAAQESRYDEEFWFWRFGTNTFQELKAVHVSDSEVEHDQIEIRFFNCR